MSRGGARGPELRTERLRMRRWRPGDRKPFAAMNADERVMEHFPAPLSASESDRMLELIESGFDARGYGLWAVELLDDGALCGFVGLNPAPSVMPFSPAVEVGWRLVTRFWGMGIATEAARAAVRFGFEEIGLEEIVSFAVASNRRSRAVMERLGMSRDPGEDFDHPGIPLGSPLRPHVLYRLRPPRER